MEMVKADTVTVRINYKWISLGLLVALLGMLAVWRPWSSTAADSRTVSVTGTITLKAEPDEYVFSPSYEFKNVDKQAALSEVSTKSDEVVAGLKKLGVQDKNIKADANGYRYSFMYDETSKQYTYTLSVQATVNTRDMAQKVQDYLVSTSPSGQVTPSAQFSDAKEKKLKDQARDTATADARKKADQMAKNLGFKVGKVKSIHDADSFDGVMPVMIRQGAAGVTEDTTSSSITVQPGQNDLTYSVSVEYYIR